MNTNYIRSLLNMYNNKNIYDIETAALIYEYFDKQEKRISDEEIERVYKFIKSQDDIYDEYVKENVLKMEIKDKEQQNIEEFSKEEQEKELEEDLGK